MAARLEWSPQAREDLLDIYVSIGIENAAAAERYFDRIEARTSLLSDHPRLGVRRPDIRASVRILVEFPYVILYETHPDTDDGPVHVIVIVRVVHGRRDLSALF